MFPWHSWWFLPPLHLLWECPSFFLDRKLLQDVRDECTVLVIFKPIWVTCTLISYASLSVCHPVRLDCTIIESSSHKNGTFGHKSLFCMHIIVEACLRCVSCISNRVFTDKLTSLVSVCTWFVYGVTTSEMKYYFSVVFIRGNIYNPVDNWQSIDSPQC